MIYTYKKKEF